MGAETTTNVSMSKKGTNWNTFIQTDSLQMVWYAENESREWTILTVYVCICIEVWYMFSPHGSQFHCIMSLYFFLDGWCYCYSFQFFDIVIDVVLVWFLTNHISCHSLSLGDKRNRSIFCRLDEGFCLFFIWISLPKGFDTNATPKMFSMLSGGEKKHKNDENCVINYSTQFKIHASGWDFKQSTTILRLFFSPFRIYIQLKNIIRLAFLNSYEKIGKTQPLA